MSLFQFMGGYLRIRIKGFSRERFLNLCAGRGIRLWDLSFGEKGFEAWIGTGDFFLLRPVLRKTKVRVTVLKKNGLPFFMRSLTRNWSFALGLLLAFVFWFFSSFFIWEIKSYGNIQVTEDQLKSFLAQNHVAIGKPISGVMLSELEKEIRRNFPQVIWTSVKQDGTNLLIDIKENELEEKVDAIATEENGENLVSDFDGVITSMIVRKGIPKVKIGDLVEKGQVLVEGLVPILAEDGSVRDYLISKADADVYIEHLIKWEDRQELCYSEKEFTGRVKKEYFIKIGEENLLLRFGRSFLMETAITKESQPKILKELKIPVIFGVISHQEYQITLKKYDSKELDSLIAEKIMHFLSTLEEKGVQIIEKNVKIEAEGMSCLIEGEFVVNEKAALHRDGEM